ncbi:polyamine aminopropyltransferase [Brevibacillus massiliensis]|uniref:polyamine aminopropyltransferase n=1 Tax=Brevibacillus massiliensis TaxID=1118054 RepID=UPI0002D48DBE|nr:polyamine aminopropyltransferase [Brevibacillus massiliensis]
MKRLPMYLHRDKGELWLTENERENLKLSYRIRQVVFEETSPFQHVMILDSYDFGRMLVLDGIVQTTSADGYIYNEMIVHVPLAYHPRPRRVLIIGGGDCGAAREACKHPHVEQIDMVEIDERVVEACKTYLPEVSGNLSDPRVRFLFTDGVRYARQPEGLYDVIIVDSSDPIGPAEQLFEQSFYQHLYRALKDDGMMVCQSQSPIFHAEVMQQTYARMSSVYPHVHMYTAVVPTYPGGLWSFTIGAKQPLAARPRNRFDLETKYVNQEILTGCFQLPQFLKQMINTVETVAI